MVLDDLIITFLEQSWYHSLITIIIESVHLPSKLKVATLLNNSTKTAL